MSWREDEAQARLKWRGPRERYDLIREGLVAVAVVGALLVGLTTLFGSPRLAGVSLKSWSTNAPADFVATALTELVGTSETATYGPPYNHGTGQVQSLGSFSIQSIVGIQLPVDAPRDLVLAPLSAFAPFSPELRQALDAWNGASPARQGVWSAAAQKARLEIEGSAVKLDGDVGPIPVLLGGMLTAARSGALDGQLIDAPGKAYSMGYTKSLLFIADGNYLGNIASKYALQGGQWGVMNEIGSWPGQPWLWFYTLFYQVPPWSTVGTDIVVIATVTPLILLVMFLPFLPGLRSIPRWIGVYRLIWRDYYKRD
jgi:hypothetical protein